MNNNIRGVRFVRWGMLSSGNIVTNDVTNKMSGNEKGYYVTSKKEGLDIWGVEKKPKINQSEPSL